MKSYSETYLFDPPVLRLLSLATKIVTRLPDPPPGEPLLRCHEVARAVGQLLELDVQDGRYGVVEHSWLWLTHYPPTPRTALLDVYCVGRLPQVQLVDLNAVLPHWKPHWRLKRGWKHLGYDCGSPRTDIRPDVVRQLVRVAMGSRFKCRAQLLETP